MSTKATIKVTECDNEIVIYATNQSHCYEITRIVSGNSNSVNAEINIKAGEYFNAAIYNGINGPIGTTEAPDTRTVYLESGSYNLFIIGSDWGGSNLAFKASYTTNAVTTSLLDIPSKPSEPTKVTTYSRPDIKNNNQFEINI